MKLNVVTSGIVMAAICVTQFAVAQTSGTTGRWDLRGNSATNPTLNFLGTTDAQELNLRTNNIQRMNFNATTGNIGVGAAADFQTRFHISTVYDDASTNPDQKMPRTLSISNLKQGTATTSPADQIGVFCNVKGNFYGATFNNSATGGVFRAESNNATAKGLEVVSTSAQMGYATGVDIAVANSHWAYGVKSVVTGTPLTGVAAFSRYAVYAEIAAKPNSWAGWFKGNINVTDTGVIKRLRVGTAFASSSPNLIQVGSTTGDGITIGSQEFLRDGGANILQHQGSLRPNTDAIYSFGSSALRYTTVYATNGTINTSDRRDKTNITQLQYGINDIMKLNPVSFTWKDRDEEGTKLGLIAQELQTVLPEVVRDYDIEVDEATGKTKHVEAARLGVFYSDIIPVLIKGMQEQQQQIEGLKHMVEKLLANNTTGIKNISSQTTYNLVGNPNPVNGKTNISFNIPPQIKNAQIVIVDSAGKKIKSYNDLTIGNNTIVFETENLKGGIYIYSLIVDEVIVDTKILSVIK